MGAGSGLVSVAGWSMVRLESWAGAPAGHGGELGFIPSGRKNLWRVLSGDTLCCESGWNAVSICCSFQVSADGGREEGQAWHRWAVFWRQR